MGLNISPLFNVITAFFDALSPVCTLLKGNNIIFATGMCQRISCASASLCRDDGFISNKDNSTIISGIPSMTAVRRLMERASAVYCDNVERWNCNNCLESSILYNVTNIKDPKSEVRAFIGVDHDNKNFVISFRGSITISAWLVNIRILPFLPKEGELFGKGIAIHKGFYIASDRLYEPCQKRIKSLREKFGNYKLQFTGHSLGGALALATAFQFLKNQGYDKELMEVVAFSSPMIGNKEFGDYMSRQRIPITNFIYEKDWVPKTPYFLEYKHVGNLVSYREPPPYTCILKRNGQGTCDSEIIDELARKKNTFPQYVIPWSLFHQTLGGFLFDPFCTDSNELLTLA